MRVFLLRAAMGREQSAGMAGCMGQAATVPSWSHLQRLCTCWGNLQQGAVAAYRRSPVALAGLGVADGDGVQPANQAVELPVAHQRLQGLAVGGAHLRGGHLWRARHEARVQVQPAARGVAAFMRVSMSQRRRAQGRPWP